MSLRRLRSFTSGFPIHLVPTEKVTNYQLKLDPARLSLRLARDFTSSYRQDKEDFFYDMFGQLGDIGLFELPKPDHTDLVKACLERVRELPDIKLMWSGGIDSTFILACYKAAGVSCTTYTYYSHGNNYCNPKLRKLISREFGNTVIYEPEDIKKLGVVYLGSLADHFFYSNQRIIGERKEKTVENRLHRGRDIVYEYLRTPFVPLEQRMLDAGHYSEEEIHRVLDLADRLHLSLDTNNRIVRFLGLFTTLPRQMFVTSMPYHAGMESFFARQRFIDIAYTQFWDCNDRVPHNKALFKNFIREVFGSDFNLSSNYF